MTTTDIPVDPSVLNTAVRSNFAYSDQLWVVAGLSGICTVPVVREEQGVTVVGVLPAAIDAGRISEETADEWLSTWTDEIGYYVPYRNITDYR